jgi:hypothetical protein
MIDSPHRYHTDPEFHARVHIGAHAVLSRWEQRSVTNTMLGDRAWDEALMISHIVLKAVEDAE